MREVTTKVYSYDELSDEAKARARDRWREGQLYDEWWDSVYEDVDTIFKIIGITSDRYVKCMDGQMRRKGPDIRFSGFSSQGDGACFEGAYTYLKGANKAIREYAPTDDELHKIVGTLTAAQMRNGYKLEAQLRHMGRYYHEHCVEIEVFKGQEDAPEKVVDEVCDALRDLMRWIYRRLEQEHDYLLSDECVEESIGCAEVEFTEYGALFS